MEQSAKTKERFSETNESFTMLEAINEAKRCLHCKAPQCSKGCPISQDIPDWIHELSMGNLDRNEVPVGNGDRVFVIGCGNTAMDAARSAVRLGAEKVTVVYHRTINDMSALRSEYDEAVSEGVEFEWQSSIVDIHDDAGDITDVVIECNGERHEEDADVVIMAVGSQPASRIVSTTEGIDVDDRGYVLTRDMPYGMTTRKGVFAGGDVVNRPSTVVLAMSDAKKVAEGIAQYVDAIKLLEAIS